MKHFILAILVIVGCLTLVTQAIAAPLIFNDEASFLAAAGPTTTYGFETHGVTEGIDLTSPLAANQLDSNFDLAYTNLNAFEIIDNAAAAGVADGTHYLFTHSVYPAPDYTLTISNFGDSNASITAFGFTITDFASNLNANDGPVFITYNTGSLTGTLLTVVAGQPDYTQNFVGLTVDAVDAFTSITLTMNDNLSGFQDFDKVMYSQVAPVPEPSTLLLLGIGLGGLGLLRRKRKLSL